MKISIITLFPEMFPPILNTSILGRAQKKGKIEFELINLRDFGIGVHKIVDDKPYGGGAGMLLKADVLASALKSIKRGKNSKVLLTTASGKLLKQKMVRELSLLEHIIIVCGRYEGVDQRFIERYVDIETCIGEYVLTGGEIPAMIIADCITRLLPGVLEKEEATLNESFENGLLEHPQYTRPERFEGLVVPDVLKSGNHKEIADWKKKNSKPI